MTTPISTRNNLGESAIFIGRLRVALTTPE